MPDEINYEELAADLAQKVEDLNIKLFAMRQTNPITTVLKDWYEAMMENPVQFIALVGLFYMTTVWLHAHYNMFTEHRRRS